MIMNVRFLLLMLCANVNLLHAQEIKVRDVVELTTDITARSAARQDNNGKECAVVRVNIPTIKTMNFGNIVGDVTYSAGEYILYLSEGTQQIPYSVKGYKDGVIDFAKYGVTVTGKTVYRATLYISDGGLNKQGSSCTLKLTTQPESALILIDGIPVGQSPLTVDDLQAGDHVISFPNSICDNLEGEEYSGYTLSDQTVTLKAGETLERHFTLEKRAIFDVTEHIEQDGSDNDATGWWPVKYRVKIKDGKEGLVDYWNREVVPCKYDYVDKNSSGNIFVVGLLDENDNYKRGLYKSGKGQVLPCEYGNFLWDDETPLIRACKDGQWGLVDFNGNTVVPCKYENISSLQCGVHVVYLEEKTAGREIEKYGLLGADGHVIVEPQYDFITSFSEGYAGARNFDGNTFLIDSLGRTTDIPAGYHPEWSEFLAYEGGCYSDGLFCLIKEGKFGLLDKSGKEVIPFIYDNKYIVLNGWCVLKRYVKERKEYEYMVVDKNGHSYQCSEEEYHGQIGQYMLLKRDGKYGLIDQNGKTALTFKYNSIDERGDYIVADNEGQTYIFDRLLKECMSFESDDNLQIRVIKDDIILLCDLESKRYGYMNMKGELLAGCLYEDGSMENVYLNLDGEDHLITHGLAMLCVGDRCGFVDKEGRIVVPLIYSAIVPFDDGTVYALKQDGTWDELDLDRLKK